MCAYDVCKDSVNLSEYSALGLSLKLGLRELNRGIVTAANIAVRPIGPQHINRFNLDRSR